jgi:ribosomal protein L37E
VYNPNRCVYNDVSLLHRISLNDGTSINDELLMFMSMRWDYVSELLPPRGLLFIPRWYEYTAALGRASRQSATVLRGCETQSYSLTERNGINCVWKQAALRKHFWGKRELSASERTIHTTGNFFIYTFNVEWMKWSRGDWDWSDIRLGLWN